MHRTDIIELTLQEFPERLREIADPPERLFVRGALPDFARPTLTVVGSRKYSPYGKDACETLIDGLSGTDVIIVSGLALGIDSIAHHAALRAGLTTVAVPGSGLSDPVIYPRAHVGLAHRILESGGALISEFAPDFRATNWSFPQRNRIMAGLSHAVLVVEATERSGTLITSRLATEYNRDVFAVPGDIFREGSKGPNMLISLGATPIRSSDDIRDALGIDRAEPSEQPEQLLLDLPDEERRILELLETPVDTDAIIDTLKITPATATVLLMRMELAGLIVQEGGMIHKRR
jgi:DNA processing protein